MSSLPTLNFGAKPPFSLEKFLAVCAELVPEEDLRMIRSAQEQDIERDFNAPGQPTLKSWINFETALRNELVKIRAARRHANAAKYLRGEAAHDASIAHMALAAYRKNSITESEMALDYERWKALEELAIGHYFDIDACIIYALKLAMLERRDRAASADAAKLLEEALT